MESQSNNPAEVRQTPSEKKIWRKIRIYYAVIVITAFAEGLIAYWLTCSNRLFFWELTVLAILPQTIWLLIRTGYRVRATARRLDQELEFHSGQSEYNLFVECGKIIHYFTLLGKDISATSMLSVNKAKLCDEKDPAYDPSKDLTAHRINDLCDDDNIASALAKMQPSIMTDEGIPTAQDNTRARLYLIHDYLSAELTNCTVSDNSVTVETIDEAVNPHFTKLRIADYFIGAVYCFLLTVVIQSYTNRLQGDHADLHRADSAYSAFIVIHPKHEIERDTIIDSAGKAPRIVLDTLPNDSLRLRKRDLFSRTGFVRKDMELYPLTVESDVFYSRDSSLRRDTTGRTYFQAKSNQLIYQSGMLLEDLIDYILPMLYGLLGAYLYVVRQIANQVKVFDLTWKKMIRHRARLIFGLFVGMFFGYLYRTPGTASISLTPFVLAFVGGYQVEMLFTLLDKIASTFSNQGSELKKTGT